MNKLLLPLVSLCLLASCSDEPVQPTPITALEFATVVDPGIPALVEIQRTDFSEPVMLSAAGGLSYDYKAGDRIIIYYKAEVADTTLRPVPVTIMQDALVFQGNATDWGEDIRKLFTPAQTKVLSAWRTGDYLNMQVKIKYSGHARFLMLGAKKESLDTDTVRLFLFNLGKEVSDSSVYARSYASYNISEVVPRGKPYTIDNLE